MIDTHCHLTFPQLRDRADAVVAAAQEAGVTQMICVGTTPADAFAARDLAHRFGGVFFTVGVHPHYAEGYERDAYLASLELVDDPKCVAVGEMGIDYHYDDPPRDVQHGLFRTQLAAISERAIDKPIVIHCRKAVDDTLAIIRESGIDPSRFVFHCFTEEPSACEKVLELGCWISFTGIVTYKNAPEVRQSAELVPLERIMVETDAPYLSPEPYRKVRPNEPKFVVETARFLADLRGMSAEAFEALTDANAKRFYGLP